MNTSKSTALIYRKKPETGIKEGSLEYSDPENKTTFSGVPLLKEIFPLKRPEKSCSIYFPTGFSETNIMNSKREVKEKTWSRGKKLGHVVKSLLIGCDNHYSSASLCDNIPSYLDDILTFQ